MMSRLYFLTRAASLLCILAFLARVNSVDAKLVRRHDNGYALPGSLQSPWHAKHVPRSDMTSHEAMAHYFPNLKKRWNIEPHNSSCNDTSGNGGGGSSNATSYALRNYNTIASVYNLTVYPKNLALFLNDTAIGLPYFNTNVTGRVTPLGNFSGYDDNIEYFWGLAPVPLGGSTLAISNAKVTQFSSGCPEVAASTVELTVTNVVGPNNGTYVTTLKEIAFWRFDDSGLISAYDAWIPNLDDFVERINNPSVAIYPGGFYSPNATERLGQEEIICGLESEFCTGGNQQYTNVTECIGVLESKPYGSYDETWGDNVVCRRIHALLTPIRPAVHCPHIGPTGGDKCVDIDYNVVYFDDLELFGATDLFNCPGIFL